MIIPVFPFLIDKLGASGSALGILVATAALTEFIFGPIWGSISDRVGRKPILMIGVLDYGISLLLNWLFLHLQAPAKPTLDHTLVGSQPSLICHTVKLPGATNPGPG